MTPPSSRDLEQLSAYLDGQLSQSSRTRLDIRIHSDPAFASALEELRQTRALLRRTPHRRAPRNFTLTPGMAGIRPPIPRLVPVLSWASAVAMLFFIFTLGAGLVGQLSLGMVGVSMNAAAPRASGAGPLVAATAAPSTAAPAIMAPEVAVSATAAPLGGGSSNPSSENQAVLPTPTEEISIMPVEQATPPGVVQVAQSSLGPKTLHRPVNLWLFIWPGLAVLLGALAILAWGLNKRAFQRKNPHG
jgi:hypothetical protein